MRIRIPVRVSVCAPNHHFFLSLLLVFGLLTFPAQRLWGVNCSVVKHGAPSDAEKRGDVVGSSALLTRPETRL